MSFVLPTNRYEVMKMKEFYIAPEVEIVCFAPIERLAAEWQGWGGFSISNGGTDDSNQHITVPNETQSTEDIEIEGDKY